ncbi:hypothetical protein KCU81_g9237, partial [Aureobasidium melanogenum]|uniref:Extracellular membrane protein CFEM domain-containing protein n=1 Tax=Aureobasidium melanogenum (strain CBS 110374) TaxID=1043003 RepID=A0A074VK95_AURM1
MMVSVRALALILLPVAARAASSESSDQSSCVNPAGYEKCNADADTRFNTCVNEYCGGSICVSSCKGDSNCVYNNCPNVGKDCLDVCECIRNTERVACAAQDCWNQVYTCEYDELVAAMVDMCDVSGGVDTNVIPYYPAPDSAPGSCSCNQGKLLLTLNSITAQTNALYDNKTNVDEAIPNYADQATYWAYREICPNTQPAVLGADLMSFPDVAQQSELECSNLMPNTDCAGDFGFGAAVGNAMSTYYALDKLPPNGSETLYNRDGALASPTQATIVWTPASAQPPITIVAAQASKGAEKESTTAGTGATAASKTSNGANSGANSGAQGATPAAVSASTTPNAASRAHSSWLAMAFCMAATIACF